MTEIFDSSATPFSSSSTSAAYTADSIEVSFGDYSFSFPAPESNGTPYVQVYNNASFSTTVDGYNWHASPSASDSQYGLTSLDSQGLLLSSDTSRLNSTALPVQAFSLSVFDQQQNMQLSGESGDTYEYVSAGSVTTDTVEAIPEPSESVLLVAGLAMLFGLQRVCRREAQA